MQLRVSLLRKTLLYVLRRYLSRAEIGYRDRRRGSLMASNEISGGITWRTKLRTHLWRSEALCISERRSEPHSCFVGKLTPREEKGENPNEIASRDSVQNTGLHFGPHAQIP
ncbi:hypothetical protein F2Q69_00025340 [Brassica cretica]|uniref:Uncharacterized protein n=1 Tax=Brassica cretica TaxID=69181 RepID=A0A8S9Q7T1_BRACR|nr:hypothetical protein F2Q69_00025340 [Brassica cretica]